MRKRIKLQNLTVQVLLAILLGIAVGYAFPDVGARLKVLADVFIKMIKMIIPPVVFFTVVLGIANMGDMKKLGRVGGKALLYFEIVTTFALIIGMIVVNVIQPVPVLTERPYRRETSASTRSRRRKSIKALSTLW